MAEVIHIGPDPTTIGGMQTVLRTIAQHSIGSGDIAVMPTWSSPSIAGNARLVARAARVILSSRRRAILHVHLSDHGAYLRDPPLAALARGRGMRVVFSLHGHDFAQFADAHPHVVRAALTWAHHVTCLSEEAAAAAALAVGRDRVSLLPNPVCIDLDSPPAGECDPVVLFAGVVGRRKGVDVLVDAWRRLLEAGVEGVCRVVGPIDDYRPPELERLVVDGPASPHTIPGLIRGARVVTLPSRSEGMPMILTEAMAAARPFVATHVGGTRLLAADAEMIVPVEDPHALADALARYLTDPAVATAEGRRAQALCAATRSPEIISARLRAIYDAC